jgi:ribose/xylose/arabinose/galactoside ABC-type transport system permease subunit
VAGHAAHSAGIAIPLAILWIIFAIKIPEFLTAANISNLFLAGSVVGVLALGSTIVILTEEIDLSIGAVEGLTAVVAAIVIIEHGVAWPLGIAITIGVGLLIGLLNGGISTMANVPSFIVTLGMMGVAGGLALILTDGQSIYGFPSDYQYIGQGELFGIRMPVYVFLGVLMVLWILLRFTRFGWHIYATGGSRAAARLVGIRTTRVRIAAFAISGVCAALAGILVSARLDTGSPIFGRFDLLDAIAAVVIGGTSLAGGAGSIVGTAFGVILITTVRNGLNLMNVSPFWQDFTIGAIIVVSAVLSELNRRLQARRRLNP